MSNFAKIVVLLCFFSNCRSNETQIIKNELSESAKIIAIGSVEKDILLKRSDSVVAKTLSDDFSTIYGGKWVCFVGLKGFIESLIPAINAAPNTTLWFAVNTTNVLLFKTFKCEPPGCYNYKDVIELARTSTTLMPGANNLDNSTVAAITLIIKEALANVDSDCETLEYTAYTQSSGNCYHYLSYRIYRQIKAKYLNSIIVNVGKFLSGSDNNDSGLMRYSVLINQILEITIYMF